MKSAISRSAAWLFTTRKRTPTKTEAVIRWGGSNVISPTSRGFQRVLRSSVWVVNAEVAAHTRHMGVLGDRKWSQTRRQGDAVAVHETP